MTMINGLYVANMTPHPINIIDAKYTYITRYSMAFINDEMVQNDSDAIIETIPTTGTPLTVQEDESLPDRIGNLLLYDQMGNARFNQNLNRSILDNNDIIIVSNKCARLLLTMSNGIIAGTNQSPGFTLFTIDKFYVPKTVVYRQNQFKNVAIGALGLQAVSPILTVEAYAGLLKLNNKSGTPVPVPISAASAYKSYNEAISKGFPRTDSAMRIVESYLTERGIL